MKTNRSVLVAVMLAILATLGLAAVSTGQADPVADNGTTVSVGPPPGTVGKVIDAPLPWVTTAPMSEGESRPAGAVVGSYFYVIGGEATGGVRNGLVQRYDPGTNTWDNTAPTMPTPGSNLCAAVVGTDIYIPGGYTGTAYLSTLQVFHTATNTWETVATDPVPVTTSGPACTSFGGKVYVFGGYNGTAYIGSTYVYDPAAAAGSRWTMLADAPTAGAYGDAIAAGGYIFYAGMRNSVVADLASVHRYDPAANTWASLPNLTTARGAARMWTYEGQLAVGGGGWSTYLTSVEQYPLASGLAGTWTAGNPLVAGRRTFAAAQDNTNGRLFAGAGYNGGFMTSAETSLFTVPVELQSLTIE